MKTSRRNKGSILLLVIGLLTMVAMIGGTFLIIARMNTRQVKDSGGKLQVDSMAAGMATSMANRLAADLRVGEVAPFSLPMTTYTVSGGTTTDPLVYDATITYPNTASPDAARLVNYNGSLFVPSPNENATVAAPIDPTPPNSDSPPTVAGLTSRWILARANVTGPESWKIFIDCPTPPPTNVYDIVNGSAHAYLCYTQPYSAIRSWLYWEDPGLTPTARLNAVVNGLKGVQTYRGPIWDPNAAGYSSGAVVTYVNNNQTVSAFHCVNTITAPGIDPTNANNQITSTDTTKPWAVLPLANLDASTDANGYLMMNALPMPTSATTANGRFFVAVGAADTSGRINVNTAYDNTASTSGGSGNLTTPAISPANVGLGQFLGRVDPSPGNGSGLWNRFCIIQNRNVFPAKADVDSYNQKVALQLPNPVLTAPTNCSLPTSISVPVTEEPFLAYYKPGDLGFVLKDASGVYHLGPSQYGRLVGEFELCGCSGANALKICEQITTWSSSRPLLRHPEVSSSDPTQTILRAAAVNRLTLNGANWSIKDYLASNDAESNTARQNLYRCILAMLKPAMVPPLNAADATNAAQIERQKLQKECAASMVANLMYYHDPSNEMGTPALWSFQPAGETFTAYAVPPLSASANNAPAMPFYVTEVYWKRVSSTAADGTKTHKEIKAIELHNFSDQTISSFASYAIQAGGKIITFNDTDPVNPNASPVRYKGTGSIAPGASLVLVTGMSMTEDNGFLPDTPPNVYYLDSADVSPTPDGSKPDFDFKNPVTLLRGKWATNKWVYLPTDQVPRHPFGTVLSDADYNTLPDDFEVDTVRDDTDADLAYAVADAVKTSGGIGTPAPPPPADGSGSGSGSGVSCTHSLGTANTNITYTDIQALVPTAVALPPMLSKNSSNSPYNSSVGDLSEVYCCGPIAYADGTYSTLPTRICGMDLTNPGDATQNNFLRAFPRGTNTTGGTTSSPGMRGRLDVNLGISKFDGSQQPAPMGTGLNQDLFPGWPKDATSIQSGTATIITPTNPGYYPDVPIACLLGEFVEFVPADPNRTDDARNYGKINVNTATADVLRALPWPAMPLVGNPTKLGTNPTNDISAYAAEFILAYRDRRVVQISPSNAIVPDYSNRAAATHIANLRAYSDFNGFVTPGEVAIPLADLMLAYLANGNNALTLSNPVLYTDATARTVVLDPTKPATVNNLKKLYPFVRDYLYRSVSNLLTVRSDTFTVYIDVELRDIYGQKTLQSPWHYMALIDRSNCRKAGDKPAVLMFTEIK